MGWADKFMSELQKTTDKSEKHMEFVPHGTNDSIKLSISIVRNLIAVPTATGQVCSDNDAIKFMMMCKARRLNPFEGDAFLIGYDTKDGPKFSLITAHQAFLKRAETNPEYDGMMSGVIVKRGDEIVDVEGDFHFDNDVILGGWAKVFFKNRSQPMHKRLRLSRFNTNRSQWAKDPAGMICKCAEADALRSSFPTMLGGMYLREEVEITQQEQRQAKKPLFPDAKQEQVAPIEVVGEFSTQPMEPEAKTEQQAETGEQKN
jgi:phage recombination protein Bet